MARLTVEDKLEIMNMVSEIASGAARNPNVAWTPELQTQLVQGLYKTMVGLIAQDDDADGYEDEDDDDGEIRGEDLDD